MLYLFFEPSYALFVRKKKMKKRAVKGEIKL